MDTNLGMLLLFQLVLIFLNAIFACAEIAVLSVNETKLEKMAEEGSKKAKRLWKLTREPAKFLATIQVAITLSGFLGSAFAADNFAEPLVAFVKNNGFDLGLPAATLRAIAVIVITLILSYVTLIFGELVPKRLAMKKAENIAMGISGLVSGVSVLFKPIVWLLSASTNVVLRMFGIDPNEADDEVSEEEIRMMVDAGSEKGTIDHEEKELIQNVFEFNDIVAGDIATHRTDVTILFLEDDDEAWREAIHETRHTLYPVCDGSPDKIVGILNAKDYFRLNEDERDRESVLENAVSNAYFVPETIKADVLFRNMKTTRNSIAVVLDEYGGMTGIITLFDLIEELVGDLNEEPAAADDPEPTIEKIDEETFRITGNVELRDIEEETGLELDDEEYGTLTGLVFDELGSIPDDGEQEIELSLEEFDIKVTKISEHQVEEATLILKPKAEPEDGDDD